MTYEVPKAFADDYGGRPGLTAETTLGPPIIDPSDAMEMPPATYLTVGATSLPPIPVIQVPPPAPAPLATPVRDSTPVEDIVRAVLAQVNTGTPAAQPAAAPTQYITATLSGAFGSFKTRCAEVLFCENHVALLYTGNPGHDDLLFQPPLLARFKLTVDLKPKGVRTVTVMNCGFSTPLPYNGGTLVLLPFTQETDTTDGEEEHDFSGLDPMQQLQNTHFG